MSKYFQQTLIVLGAISLLFPIVLILIYGIQSLTINLFTAMVAFWNMVLIAVFYYLSRKDRKEFFELQTEVESRGFWIKNLVFGERFKGVCENLTKIEETLSTFASALNSRDSDNIKRESECLESQWADLEASIIKNILEPLSPVCSTEKTETALLRAGDSISRTVSLSAIPRNSDIVSEFLDYKKALMNSFWEILLKFPAKS